MSYEGGPKPEGKENANGTTEISPNPIIRVSSVASLKIPNFRLLLTGTMLANAANWIQQLTLSWLVYDLTGSGIILGTINLVRAVGALLMVPFAGLLIDRISRRKLITIENSCLFAIAFTIGISVILGHKSIAFLFILSFVAGVINTVDQTLRQVLIFDMVPRDFTPNAVALVQTGWSLMRIVGPSIGGFFIVWFGAGGNFLVQAGMYVLIATTILQIKFPKRKPTLVGKSPLQNISAGINYVIGERVTRTFTMMGIIMPILTIPIFTILPPIYAVEIFKDTSGRVLGLLMGAVGVGGIIGGVAVASLGHFEHRGRLQLSALFILAISLIAFAFNSSLTVALLLLVLAGLSELIFLSTNQTLIQLSIPDHLRGRVTAVTNLNSILSPMGGLLAGAGSDLLGGPKIITIALAGTAGVIAIIVFALVPTVRDYRLTQGIESKRTQPFN